MKYVMRTLIAVVSLTCLGSAALATSGHEMWRDAGPVLEVQIQGHTMHMQAVKDKNGGQFVILERDEFEALTGHKLEGMTFTDFANGH